MKENVTLTVASLLAILLTSLHHAGDVARGMAPGGLTNLVPVAVLLLWLYGTLVLGGRRSGYIIILIAAFLAAGLPIVHMTGSGLAGGSANAEGDFFFGWTLLALEITALFCVILASRALWSMRRSPPREFAP